ncbi:hypothetical protein D779_1806 [Imhoffiella purpurea]|uniref:Uncharacterized protein n=1 Tax=Imhoffiella purpurea TaxID=1249627 RepID=W9VBM0_9GAMM|nr:hypothetical protein D779_1806 [Imhoffiella purpurea]
MPDLTSSVRPLDGTRIATAGPSSLPPVSRWDRAVFVRRTTAG